MLTVMQLYVDMMQSVFFGVKIDVCGICSVHVTSLHGYNGRLETAEPPLLLTRLCVLYTGYSRVSSMRNTVAFYQVRMLNSTHNCALDPRPCVELLLGVDRQGVKEKDRRTPPQPPLPHRSQER